MSTGAREVISKLNLGRRFMNALHILTPKELMKGEGEETFKPLMKLFLERGVVMRILKKERAEKSRAKSILVPTMDLYLHNYSQETQVFIMRFIHSKRIFECNLSPTILAEFQFCLKPTLL